MGKVLTSLSETLGIELHIDNDGFVHGQGTGKVAIGPPSRDSSYVMLPISVVSQRVGTNWSYCVLLVRGPADIGFFVAYDRDRQKTWLSVIDVSKIEQTRKHGLFSLLEDTQAGNFKECYNRVEPGVVARYISSFTSADGTKWSKI